MLCQEDITILKTKLGGCRNRCYNPNNAGYHRYGGRGITVCKEWLDSPDAFVEWAETHGYEPGLTIDRIDNDQGYRPDNCRFVTPKVQQNNTSANIMITHEGKTQSVSLWADEVGIAYCTLWRRLGAQGMAFEDAIKIKGLKNGRYLTYQGETLPCAQWAVKLGIGISTIHNRLRYGWPVEKVLAVGDNRLLPTGRDTRLDCNRSNPLYNTWSNIRQQVNNPRNPRFVCLPGGGTAMCKEWLEDFTAFAKWAIADGWKKGLAVARAKGDEAFGPTNCRCIPRGTTAAMMLTRDGVSA